MTPSSLHFAALLLYAVAAGISLVRLFLEGKGTLERGYLVTMTAAFVLQSGAIVTMIQASGQLPFTNRHESLLTLSWILVLFFFILRWLSKATILSFFMTPVVFLLAGWSYLLKDSTAHPVPAGVDSPVLFWSHILFALLGTASLVLGVAFGWMYQIQERSLRAKTSGRLAGLIPSLSTCDRWGRRAIAVGFVLYTVGILHAALWVRRTRGDWIEANPKELGSLVAWVVFAILLQARMTWGPRGRSQAILGAVGIAALTLAIVGIR